MCDPVKDRPAPLHKGDRVRWTRTDRWAGTRVEPGDFGYVDDNNVGGPARHVRHALTDRRVLTYADRIEAAPLPAPAEPEPVASDTIGPLPGERWAWRTSTASPSLLRIDKVEGNLVYFTYASASPKYLEGRQFTRTLPRFLKLAKRVARFAPNPALNHLPPRAVDVPARPGQILSTVIRDARGNVIMSSEPTREEELVKELRETRAEAARLASLITQSLNAEADRRRIVDEIKAATEKTTAPAELPSDEELAEAIGRGGSRDGTGELRTILPTAAARRVRALVEAHFEARRG